MLLKTIAFLLLLYLLIKMISRLFLPSPSSKRSGNARMFYHIFKNIREQQKKQGRRQQNSRNNSSGSDHLEEIEEAEYEEIEEDKESKE